MDPHTDPRKEFGKESRKEFGEEIGKESRKESGEEIGKEFGKESGEEIDKESGKESGEASTWRSVGTDRFEVCYSVTGQRAYCRNKETGTCGTVHHQDKAEEYWQLATRLYAINPQTFDHWCAYQDPHQGEASDRR